jgi:hypothetical protein
MKKTVKICICMLFSILQIRAYEGDGTFYQIQPKGEMGACMLPRGFNEIGQTVAINHDQYNNGEACGKCVLIHPVGSGSGMTPITQPIFATIDNECPECKHGDIDIGANGDGRWQISWQFVPCHRRLRASY